MDGGRRDVQYTTKHRHHVAPVELDGIWECVSAELDALLSQVSFVEFRAIKLANVTFLQRKCNTSLTMACAFDQ